jgi:hypothetical protein
LPPPGCPSLTSHLAIKELLRGMIHRIGTPLKAVGPLLSEDMRARKEVV